jgi:hypothetical protein
MEEETRFVDSGRPPSLKVEKPWGKFEQYAHNVPCTVKIITVDPGGILSSQYHHLRDELWVVLDSGAPRSLRSRGPRISVVERHRNEPTDSG